MRRLILALALVLLPFPLLADEWERLLLPVMPSTVFCGYGSRYDTKLLVFNESGATVDVGCFGMDCSTIEARHGREISGPVGGGVPYPAFIFVPRAAALTASLLVESSHKNGADRFFTEIPVIRDKDFRQRIEFLGVRFDPDYRQSLRIFGDQRDAGTPVRMRVYDLATGALMHEHHHTLYVFPLDATELMWSPAFSMECDLSELDPTLVGRQFRITLDTEGTTARIWAFISVTSNATQHFYNILPR